jgi:hypothetical protein
MRQFSAIVFVLLLVTMPSCKFLKEKNPFGKKKKDNIELMLARQDSIRSADSVRKAQDKLVALENAKLDSIRISQEKPAVQDANHKYNIIVGSFYTPEYARALAEDYRSKGYNPSIIQMQRSRFELVSVESYDSFSQTVTRLREFQGSIEPDSWIYILN